MDCLNRHRPLIAHVHVKDVDPGGRWVGMGQGITPVSQLFTWLEETGYPGWVVIEEESDGARQDPAAAVAANRRYLESMGY
jgi:inosose dehydratase